MTRISKGKARSPRSLQRNQPRKRPYDHILIVCEGRKTEPQYFKEISQEAKLSTLEVCISPSLSGPQPLQVVEFAVEKFHETKGFEKIFAVFDRDEHISYANAIAKAKSLDGKMKNDEGEKVLFKAIVSVPSFELWFLLHYTNIQAYHHQRIILHRLREYIPHYEKGTYGLYSITKNALPIATERAQKLRERFSPLPGDEAYTDVDTLVETLQTLKLQP